MKLLRPQFSLRTLLIVTALIAVGAKLWYGPYHVVETINGVEHEYDYYRGFGWEKVKHGVVVERMNTQPSNTEAVIRFFRNGQDTGHETIWYLVPAQRGYALGIKKTGYLAVIELSSNERLLFDNTVNQEREKLSRPGYQEKTLYQFYYDEL